MTIALISVYSHDQMMQEYYNIFLYGLLSERETYQNISHKEMPKFENHVKFVKSKPYKEWFVLYDTNKNLRVGSVYLTKENEIGIFISKNQRGKRFGKSGVLQTLEYFKHVREVKANIAPTNSASMCFFSNIGFRFYEMLREGDLDSKIIQHTYKITNPYYVEHAKEEIVEV